MTYVKGLRCRECGGETPVAPLHVCETCFGPLEVAYDYDAIKRVFTRELIESRPRNLWRYRELLPVAGEPKIGLWSGFTPLVRAERLGDVLGVKELWVKDDSVNHPTFSYKDRVVSVAISKAIEFGFDTVSCASTGNLANSVSAHAARAGLNCYIFIPDDLEQGKVIGSTIYGPRAATTTTSTVSAARSPTSTAGRSSTSTCGRTTPRAPRRTASRSRSSSAGSSRSTSSCRPPAARSFRRWQRASRSSVTWGSSTATSRSTRRRPAAARR